MNAAENRAVFLSYASQDAEAARRICDALRAVGIEVWFDQNELRGGDAWDQKIRKQIRECALFVPVISANTQARAEGYFRLEWRLADQRTHLMGKSKAFLLPVCIDDTRDTDADVPDSFLAVQWTRLRHAGFGGRARIGSADSLDAFCARAGLLLKGATRVVGHSQSAPPIANPQPPDLPSGKSVAVLAFANLSHDPENEYFSDGISEELLNVLAKVPGLRVAARTSAFSFKGRSATVQEIGRKLGVAHLVEGSVRRAGARVRIAARLSRTETGEQIWSESYERELKDIFALQDEISRDIATKLQLTLGAATRPRKIVDPEAHRLVLEGWHFWNQRTRDTDTRAETAFRRAIAVDPGLADAYTGLAAVASGRLVFATYDGLPAKFEFEQLVAMARRSLELDPAQVAAYSALGHAYEIERRWDDSEAAYRQALAINPNDAWTRLYHYGLLAARGRLDAALDELQTASALDPLNFVALSLCAVFLHRAGRREEAAAYNERVRGLNPHWVAGVATRAVLLLAAGRNSDAIATGREVRQAREAWPRLTADPTAIWVLHNAGASDEAADYAREFIAPLAPGNYLRGFALAAQGRFGEALPALEHTPAHLFQSLYWDGIWDSCRDDLRFQQLMVKLGCAEEYKVARETLARLKERAEKR